MKFKTLLASILLIFVAVPQLAFASAAPTPVQDEFIKGVVSGISHTTSTFEFGQDITSQSISVILSTKEEVFMTHEFTTQNEGRRLKEGSRIIVGQGNSPDGSYYYVSDVYRLHGLIWTCILFALLTIIFIGRRAIGAFLGLGLSFVVIIFYLLPQVLSGAPPFMTAFIAALIIASISLFVAHGIYLRTTIAFISTMATIFLSLILSRVIVQITRLSGLGTEEAFYLQFADAATSIDIRGLLLGGILIGTLGVLDDITTAQAAAVEQIHCANSSLGFVELYKRGIAVGKEHIISLVNTLVLAYTGAALPLILLFSIYTQPIWVTLNNEIIVEELVRMLIGSIALIVAVPFTTLLAAYLFGTPGGPIRKKLSKTIFFRKNTTAHPCAHDVHDKL